jgi:Pyruvate/2-oxoacid:ferredoxin oxidoreductase gamma subunit
MLGAFAAFLDFSDDEWKRAIEASVPKKTVEVNLAGFALGRKAAGGR